MIRVPVLLMKDYLAPKWFIWVEMSPDLKQILGFLVSCDLAQEFSVKVR